MLTLRGCDVVLVVKWLKTLDPIMLNFSKMTMQFMSSQKIDFYARLEIATTIF